MRIKRKAFKLLIGCLLSMNFVYSQELSFEIPKCDHTITVDGDLNDWKLNALNNGNWNIDRVKIFDWYNPKRNKLNFHQGEDSVMIDLEANYYIAWNEHYLFLGAEVIDNINDVSEENHEPKRWYYKDAIAWFIEIPSDTIPEKFEEGNHGFAFVADSTYPAYGAWWRHGSKTQSYIEEPIPSANVEYAIRFQENTSNYILEAKLDIRSLFNIQQLEPNQCMSMMIVHCDPDGGEYGGHMLIYGKGDLDTTWSSFKFKSIWK